MFQRTLQFRCLTPVNCSFLTIHFFICKLLSSPRKVYEPLREQTMRTSKTSTTRELAHQLLAFEEVEGTRPMSDINPAIRVCEKVRHPLARLAGAAGYHALLSRAMVLAKQDYPTLCEWEVKPDGSLRGVEGDARQGGEVLVSNLLRLMFTFIGELITLQLLRDVWPELPDDSTEFERKESR